MELVSSFVKQNINCGENTIQLLTNIIFLMCEKRSENYELIIEHVELFIFRCVKYKIIYSKELLYLTMIYLYRIDNHNFLTQCSTYILFITCFIMAHKNLEDVPYDNKSFSLLANLTLKNINEVEFEFLKVFDFDVNIGEKEYTLMSNLASKII